MALSKRALKMDDAPPGSVLHRLVIQHNARVQAIWDLATKMDADLATTDYAATMEATGIRLLANGANVTVTV